MQPPFWHSNVPLSTHEEQIVQRIRRAKLFVFLRHHRHDLFDEAFQQELATLYKSSKRGHPPIAPEQLALAVILQAYTGVSDDEGDRRPRSWIEASNWCSIVWTPIRPLLAKEHSLLFANA